MWGAVAALTVWMTASFATGADLAPLPQLPVLGSPSGVTPTPAPSPSWVSAKVTLSPTVTVAAKPGSINILWPTPNKAFMDGGDISTWVQPTASGDPHSGLFGCVRDNDSRFHEGIDIKCIERDKKGNPLDAVSAVMDGEVVYFNNVAGNGDYGRYIVLEHPRADVAVYTLYAHLSAIAPGLKVGKIVAAGEVIGTMGHSGTEDIPLERAHLHFEIGLRLSDDFQSFYIDKKYPGKNEHGNYNGINLFGSDPQAFFEAVRSGKFKNFADYFRAIPTAFTLRVTTTTIPDFAKRYPALLTKPVPSGGVTGWDIDFTWYGMPKTMTPLPPGTLGLGAPGMVAILSDDKAQFIGCTCRDTLLFPTGKATTPKIGAYLLDAVRMLFRFK
jgi:murein DD-endopeptidase MepM/ murein hydrolase activator NlpD